MLCSEGVPQMCKGEQLSGCILLSSPRVGGLLLLLQRLQLWMRKPGLHLHGRGPRVKVLTRCNQEKKNLDRKPPALCGLDSDCMVMSA